MTEKERVDAADIDPEDRQMWRGRAAWRLLQSIPSLHVFEELQGGDRSLFEESILRRPGKGSV